MDIDPKVKAFDQIAARFDSYFNEEVSQTKATELLMEMLAIVRAAKKGQ